MEFIWFQKRREEKFLEETWAKTGENSTSRKELKVRVGRSIFKLVRRKLHWCRGQRRRFGGRMS